MQLKVFLCKLMLVVSFVLFLICIFILISELIKYPDKTSMRQLIDNIEVCVLMVLSGIAMILSNDLLSDFISKEKEDEDLYK